MRLHLHRRLILSSSNPSLTHQTQVCLCELALRSRKLDPMRSRACECALHHCCVPLLRDTTMASPSGIQFVPKLLFVLLVQQARACPLNLQAHAGSISASNADTPPATSAADYIASGTPTCLWLSASVTGSIGACDVQLCDATSSYGRALTAGIPSGGGSQSTQEDCVQQWAGGMQVRLHRAHGHVCSQLSIHFHLIST